MSDQTADKLVPLHPRSSDAPQPTDAMRYAGAQLAQRLQAGDDFRAAMKVVFGWDYELEAAIDAAWPAAECCEYCRERGALLMCVAEVFPETRTFMLEELPHFPINRAEFERQAACEV
ncbi:MAG: hypothetical protein AB7I59_07460 [Geminicoccaceae bacterium]